MYIDLLSAVCIRTTLNFQTWGFAEIFLEGWARPIKYVSSEVYLLTATLMAVVDG